jgi:hypothetical protein
LINDASKIFFELAFFISNIKKKICDILYFFFYFKYIYLKIHMFFMLNPKFKSLSLFFFKN